MSVAGLVSPTGKRLPPCTGSWYTQVPTTRARALRTGSSRPQNPHPIVFVVDGGGGGGQKQEGGQNPPPPISLSSPASFLLPTHPSLLAARGEPWRRRSSTSAPPKTAPVRPDPAPPLTSWLALFNSSNGDLSRSRSRFVRAQVRALS